MAVCWMTQLPLPLPLPLSPPLPLPLPLPQFTHIRSTQHAARVFTLRNYDHQQDMQLQPDVVLVEIK